MEQNDDNPGQDKASAAPKNGSEAVCSSQYFPLGVSVRGRELTLGIEAPPSQAPEAPALYHESAVRSDSA